MNILSLDISTKPGWAFFKDSKLIRYGTLWADKTVEDFGPYPGNYLDFVQDVADRLYSQVFLPCWRESGSKLTVVIEETTASQNNYSQRKVEWIHYTILHAIREVFPDLPIRYVRDGVWKTKVGARQNNEEKKLNGKISRAKAKKKKAILEDTTLTEDEKKAKIKAIRAKLDLDGSGKARVVGKLSGKNYALRAFTEHFGIELQRQDEDAADAALLGWAYICGVPICDGTTTGGLNGETPNSTSDEG